MTVYFPAEWLGRYVVITPSIGRILHYVTITDTVPVVFSNPSAETVRVLSTWTRNDWVRRGASGNVISFGANQTYGGFDVIPGEPIFINTTNPADVMTVYFPTEWLGRYVTVS
jgi:hypothetical protein